MAPAPLFRPVFVERERRPHQAIFITDADLEAVIQAAEGAPPADRDSWLRTYLAREGAPDWALEGDLVSGDGGVLIVGPELGAQVLDGPADE